MGVTKIRAEQLKGITSYPPPFLKELIPDSHLPSTTGNFVLKGAFFTEDMTIVVEGQTLNYWTFISDNEVHVNLTTGATEGTFDVTLNNGLEAVFTDALLIVLGTVFTPSSTDWINVVSNPDVSTAGQMKVTVLNVAQGAEYVMKADYTKDFLIRFFPAISPLNPSPPNDSSFLIMALRKADDTLLASLVWRQSGVSHYFRTNTGNTGGLFPVSTYNYADHNMEYRNVAGTLYLYKNGAPIESYGVLTEDVRIIVGVKQGDITNIKYIELTT